MTRHSPMAPTLVAALAAVFLLTACGGGGGSPTSTSVGGGGGGGTGTVTPTTAIAWDSNGDGTVDDDDTPYQLTTDFTRPAAASTPLDATDVYNASADNDYNEWIKSLTDAGGEGQRLAQQIAAWIDNLRDGFDTMRQTQDPPSPLADFTTVSSGDRVASATPIVRNKGISRGITAEAAKDITAIEEQIDNLKAIEARAKAARKALDDEIARLGKEADTFRKKAEGLDDKAAEKRTSADMLDVSDRPEISARIDALQAQARPLRTLISKLNTYLADTTTTVPTDMWDHDNNPDTADQRLCTNAASCRAAAVQVRSRIAPLDDREDDPATPDVDESGIKQLRELENPIARKEAEINRLTALISNAEAYLVDTTASAVPTDTWDHDNNPATPAQRLCTDEASCQAFVDRIKPMIEMLKDRENDPNTEADERGIKQLRNDAADLRDKADEDEAMAAENRGKATTYENVVIPDLEAKRQTIDADLASIDTIHDDEKDLLDAERLLASDHAQASLILDTLAAGALADPGTGTLRVTANQDVTALDTEGGEAVFARATKPSGPGLYDGQGVLRHLATARGLTPDDVVTRTGDSALSLVRPLQTALADHWRLDLTGFLVVADTGLATADRTGLDGTAGQFVRGTLKGIYGTFYCARSNGCKDITGALPGEFADGWHFTPAALARTGGGTSDDPYVYSVVRYDDDPDGRPSPFGIGSYSVNYVYTDSDGDGTYEVVPYIDYGMWLTEVDGAPVIHHRAGYVGPDSLTARGRLDVTEPANDVNGLAASATYSGTAQGLAARRAGQAVASGHFHADVELNAVFGADATLGGTIDNFRSADPAAQGTNHVNSGWVINLRTGRITDTGEVETGTENLPDNGRFAADGKATGQWSAFAYGDDAGERPDGFYGGFSAAFDDDGIDQGGDGNLYDDGAVFGLFDAKKTE